MATTKPGSRRVTLRQQQEAEENARRTRRIVIASIGIGAILVIAIIAIVASQMLNRGGGDSAGEQLTPPNASGDHGVYVQAKPPVDGTPHVVVWGDYLCGGCAANDQMYGPVIDELVTSGDITAEVRQAHFLDRQAEHGPSKRAAMAAGAADAVGFFDAYHQSLYVNQQSGYTDQVLRELIPEAIGMGDDALNRFQDLYDSYSFEEWVDGAHQLFTDSGINSTPSYFVDDERLVIYDPETETVVVEPVAEEFLSAVDELFNS